MVQAANDPIAPAKAIPRQALRDNPNCILVVTPYGGHLGWVSGPGAPLGAPWSTQAVVEWMTSVQLELLRTGRSKRMTQQLSKKAIDKVSHDDRQQDGAGGANGNGREPHFVGETGVAREFMQHKGPDSSANRTQ